MSHDHCKCCKKLHANIPLIAPWPDEDDGDDECLKVLLETAEDVNLNWFDELTESRLSVKDQSSLTVHHDGSTVDALDVHPWSPCPRGGLISATDTCARHNASVTPVSDPLSNCLDGRTPKLEGFDSSPQVVSSPSLERLAIDQSDIKWTSAMATPPQEKSLNQSYRSDKSENTSMDRRDLDVKMSQAKLIHRKLFSPGMSNPHKDDSLLHLSDLDSTKETDITILQEDDVAVIDDKDKTLKSSENLRENSLDVSVNKKDNTDDGLISKTDDKMTRDELGGVHSVKIKSKGVDNEDCYGGSGKILMSDVKKRRGRIESILNSLFSSPVSLSQEKSDEEEDNSQGGDNILLSPESEERVESDRLCLSAMNDGGKPLMNGKVLQDKLVEDETTLDVEAFYEDDNPPVTPASKTGKTGGCDIGVSSVLVEDLTKSIVESECKRKLLSILKSPNTPRSAHSKRVHFSLFASSCSTSAMSDNNDVTIPSRHNINHCHERSGIAEETAQDLRTFDGGSCVEHFAFKNITNENGSKSSVSYDIDIVNKVKDTANAADAIHDKSVGNIEIENIVNTKFRDCDKTETIPCDKFDNNVDTSEYSFDDMYDSFPSSPTFPKEVAFLSQSKVNENDNGGLSSTRLPDSVSEIDMGRELYQVMVKENVANKQKNVKLMDKEFGGEILSKNVRLDGAESMCDHDSDNKEGTIRTTKNALKYVFRQNKELIASQEFREFGISKVSKKFGELIDPTDSFLMAAYDNSSFSEIMSSSDLHNNDDCDSVNHGFPILTSSSNGVSAALSQNQSKAKDNEISSWSSVDCINSSSLLPPSSPKPLCHSSLVLTTSSVIMKSIANDSSPSSHVIKTTTSTANKKELPILPFSLSTNVISNPSTVSTLPVVSSNSECSTTTAACSSIMTLSSVGANKTTTTSINSINHPTFSLQATTFNKPRNFLYPKPKSKSSDKILSGTSNPAVEKNTSVAVTSASGFSTNGSLPTSSPSCNLKSSSSSKSHQSLILTEMNVVNEGHSLMNITKDAGPSDQIYRQNGEGHSKDREPRPCKSLPKLLGFARFSDVFGTVPDHCNENDMAINVLVDGEQDNDEAIANVVMAEGVQNEMKNDRDTFFDDAVDKDGHNTMPSSFDQDGNVSCREISGVLTKADRSNEPMNHDKKERNELMEIVDDGEKEDNVKRKNENVIHHLGDFEGNESRLEDHFDNIPSQFWEMTEFSQINPPTDVLGEVIKADGGTVGILDVNCDESNCGDYQGVDSFKKCHVEENVESNNAATVSLCKENSSTFTIATDGGDNDLKYDDKVENVNVVNETKMAELDVKVINDGEDMHGQAVSCEYDAKSYTSEVSRNQLGSSITGKKQKLTLNNNDDDKSRQSDKNLEYGNSNSSAKSKLESFDELFFGNASMSELNERCLTDSRIASFENSSSLGMNSIEDQFESLLTGFNKKRLLSKSTPNIKGKAVGKGFVSIGEGCNQPTVSTLKINNDEILKESSIEDQFESLLAGLKTQNRNRMQVGHVSSERGYNQQIENTSFADNDELEAQLEKTLKDGKIITNAKRGRGHLSLSCGKGKENIHKTSQDVSLMHINLKEFMGLCPISSTCSIGATGFSTAGGKAIQISDVAQKKAVKIMESVDSEYQGGSELSGQDMNETKVAMYDKNDNAMQRHSSACLDNSNVTENSAVLEYSDCKSELGIRFNVFKETGKDTLLQNMSCSDGFVTARGKGIQLSEAGRKKAELLWESIGDDENSVHDKNDSWAEIVKKVRKEDGDGFGNATDKGMVHCLNNEDQTIKKPNSASKFDKRHKGFRPFIKPRIVVQKRKIVENDTNCVGDQKPTSVQVDIEMSEPSIGTESFLDSMRMKWVHSEVGLSGEVNATDHTNYLKLKGNFDSENIVIDAVKKSKGRSKRHLMKTENVQDVEIEECDFDGDDFDSQVLAELDQKSSSAVADGEEIKRIEVDGTRASNLQDQVSETVKSTEVRQLSTPHVEEIQHNKSPTFCGRISIEDAQTWRHSQTDSYKGNVDKEDMNRNHKGPECDVDDQNAEKITRPLEEMKNGLCMTEKDTFLRNDKFPGFTTGSGIDVYISKGALKKAKVFLDSVDDDDVSMSHKIDHDQEVPSNNSSEIKDNEQIMNADISTTSDSNLSPSMAVVNEVKTILNNDDVTNAVLEMDKDDGTQLDKLMKGGRTHRQNSFPGFSTASVSNDAPEKSKAFLRRDNDEETAVETDNDQDKKLNNLKESKDITQNSFPGFSTALGSNVSVSKKALDKAKAFLTHGENEETSHKTNADYQDAQLKLIEPGKISKQKALPRFSTASGADVSVSKKALEKAKAFLNDGNADGLDEMKEANSRINDQRNTVEGRNCFPGFSTASGLDVSVSEKALVKVKTFLNSECNLKTLPEMGDIETKMNAVKGNKGPRQNCFPSFTTASGSDVSVSEKALEKAKVFLNSGDEMADLSQMSNDQETENNVVKKNKVSGQNSVPSFSTAPGSGVSVSKNALNKAKSILSSDDSVEMMHEKSINLKDRNAVKDKRFEQSTFPGFSTALGTGVSISEEALDKAKGFLNDDAATLSVEISNAACHFAGNILTENASSKYSSSTSMSNVSKTALEQAKALLLRQKQRKLEPVKGDITEMRQGCQLDSACQETRELGKGRGGMVKISTSSYDIASLRREQDFCKDNIKKRPLVSRCEEILNDRPGIKRTKFQAVKSKYLVGGNREGSVIKDGLGSAKISSSTKQNSLIVPNTFSNKASFVPPPSTCTSSKHKENDTINATLQHNEDENNILMKCPVFLSKSKYVRNYNTRSRRALHGLNRSDTTCNSNANTNPHSKFSEVLGSKDDDARNDVESERKASDNDNILSETSSAGTEKEKSIKRKEGNSGVIAGRDVDCNVSRRYGMSVREKDGVRCDGKKELVQNECCFDNEEKSLGNLRVMSKVCGDAYAKGTFCNSSSTELDDEEENRFLCENISTQIGCGVDTCSVDDGGDSNCNENDAGGFHVGNGVFTSVPSTDIQRHCHGITGNGNVTIVRSTENETEASNSNGFGVVLATAREEARMKQEKIIHDKKRRKIVPRCGRWMEQREPNKSKKRAHLSSLNCWHRRCTKEELRQMDVSDSVLSVCSSNASNFQFDLRRFYPGIPSSVLIGDGALLVPDDNGLAGYKEFYKAFLTLDGVDPKLMDESWLKNHYRWIVWKLAAYEVCFPAAFAGRCLTPQHVMLQLKYRCDREIDKAQRGAIKKIMEKDDTSSKRMVLCVAGVRNEESGEVSLELTDGWYSVWSKLDTPLCDLVQKRKVSVGVKLVTSGAELEGVGQGCSPLEMGEGVRLSLRANSTRPAPWFSKLGFDANPMALCVPLSSLHPEGGVVGCVDVVITRTYPVMCMEKLASGGCVFRTQEEEETERKRLEGRKEKDVERIYQSVQAEMEEEEEKMRRTSGKRRGLSRKEIEGLSTGEELLQAWESSFNQEDLQMAMSEEQIRILFEYRRMEMDCRQERMNQRVKERLRECTKHQDRRVTPVQKIRVAGCSTHDMDGKCETLVTVWRPMAEWVEIKEGQRYRMYQLCVSAARWNQRICKVVLATTRQSRIQELRMDDNRLDLVYQPRENLSVKEVQSLNGVAGSGLEFDFVGVALRVESPSGEHGQPLVITSTDRYGDVMVIKMWKGPRSGTPPVKENECFVVLNLTKCSGSSQSYPVRVTAEARQELSTFSTSVHSNRYGHVVADLQQYLTKNPGFIERTRAHFETGRKTSNSKKIVKSMMVEDTITKPIGDWGTCWSLEEDYDEDFPPEIVEKIFNHLGSQSPDKVTATHSNRFHNGDQDKQLSTYPASSKVTDGASSSSSSPPIESVCPKDIKSHRSDNSAEIDDCVSDKSDNLNPMESSCRNENSSDFKSKGCSGSDVKMCYKTTGGRKRKIRDEELGVGTSKEKEEKEKEKIMEEKECERDDDDMMLKKRKKNLRTKMTKLLAYGRPAALSPLPGSIVSPSCVKQFKSPHTTK